jgi:hypothetical protein
MKRVTNGFDRMTIPEFGYRLQVIIDCMTGNAAFPDLQTAVQALSAEAAVYYPLATKAQQKDKGVQLARDASRAKLVAMLHKLGYGVTDVANNNEAILNSSGFTYTQPRKPTPPLVAPAPPQLAAGTNLGEISCKTIAQKGVTSVNYYITADEGALSATDNIGWNIFFSNKKKFTFDKLVGGQRYYVKVGFVGVKGQEVISDAVSYIAQ